MKVEQNAYALLVVGATVCYALSVNVIKSRLQGIKSLWLTAFAMTFIGPPALVYLFFTDFADRMAIDGAYQALFYLGILGVVATAFALVIFNKLVQLTSAVFASSVTYIIPIVAVAWGLLDGERLFALHYLGMTFIMIGIFIINKYRD